MSKVVVSQFMTVGGDGVVVLTYEPVRDEAS